jgi:hypothetical protein
MYGRLLQERELVHETFTDNTFLKNATANNPSRQYSRFAWLNATWDFSQPAV